MFFAKIYKFFLINFFCCSFVFCNKNPIPIIYHPNYNIWFDEIGEFIVPSYRNIYDNWLIRDRAKTIYEYFKNRDDVKIFLPEIFVQDKDFVANGLGHTQEYIESFGKIENIRKVTGFKFEHLPDIDFLQEKVLLPAKFAVAGTILGVTLALNSDCRCAINLSGGFHHAGISSGEGFCFFNDIAIATLKLLENNKNFKIFIVDLDAHWGNGTQEILGSNKQVFIFDIFNGDRQFFKGVPKITDDHVFNFPILNNTNTVDYLKLLDATLPALIKQVKPDFIIYNAGLDILAGDPLGGLCVSEQGLIERDFYVFNLARQQNIPILMVLSGGYTQNCVEVIKRSIDNIIKKFS
jgi:histone deacetylase 11